MTFRTPLPWCSYEPNDDEYTYHMPNLCSVVVAKRDVLDERVDVLVVPETPSMSGNSQLASKVLKTAWYDYKQPKGNQHPGSALACKYKGTLDYKTIVYIIMKKKWGAKDVKLYKQCISNALSTSEGTSVSIAMKLFFGGMFNSSFQTFFSYLNIRQVSFYTSCCPSSGCTFICQSIRFNTF